MAFDYKKEYKEFYLPKEKPAIVTLPKMNYVVVRGKGDPNAEDSEYKRSIGILYTISFTIKMSKRSDWRIEGYFDYVVPPLEGFWWQEGAERIDYTQKEKFNFISMIRLPDFVKKDDFDRAVAQAQEKKKTDLSAAEFLTVEEGLCVQCMHIGSYDDEPRTLALMDEYIRQNGFEYDLSKSRLHHEIYLSDARKVSPEKLRTVIREPIKERI